MVDYKKWQWEGREQSRQQMVPNNVRLFERLFPNSVGKTDCVTTFSLLCLARPGALTGRVGSEDVAAGRNVLITHC